MLYLELFQNASPNLGSYLMATGKIAPPTSKDPFLNCMMLVLLMQVPSGKISMGSFSGSWTCSSSLLNTAALSLASPLSNHI